MPPLIALRHRTGAVVAAFFAASQITLAQGQTSPLPQVYDQLLQRGGRIAVAGNCRAISHTLFEPEISYERKCDVVAGDFWGDKAFLLLCPDLEDVLRLTMAVESADVEDRGLALRVAHSYDWAVHPNLRWHERYTKLTVDPVTLAINAYEFQVPGNGKKPNYSPKRTHICRLSS